MTCTRLTVACLLALVVAVSAQAGGSYGKQPEGYFQYVNVPGHKEYEFGWNRGNPHHYISRYEQAKDHRFRTRVKWGDQKGGYGEHYYEYNHAPKYGKGSDHKGGYQDEHKGYEPPKYEAPSYKGPSYEPPSYEPPSY